MDHLELRIHGVNNTSPPAMLDLYPEQVEQVAGDRIGGFYRARAGVLDGLEPDARGWTPPSVQREAYSWGGLARTSPDGWFGGVTRTVSAGLGRLCWVLLIPFGITNIAYWTRRLPAPSGTVTRRGDAWAARLFALLLTALLVVTLSDLSMDVLARQCYGAVPNQPVLCPNLPAVFDTATDWTADQRLAAAALVPVAVLAFLWLVIGRSGSRYEAVPVTPGGSQTYVLGLPRFWAGRRMLRGLLLAHLTVGLTLVTLISSWAALIGTAPGCRTWADLGSCWSTVRGRPSSLAVFAWLGGLALVVAVAAVVVLVWRSGDAADLGPVDPPAVGSDGAATARAAAWCSVGLFVAAIALLVVDLVALALASPIGPQARAVPGFSALPSLLTALAFGLGMSATAWRWTLARSGGARVWRSLVPVAALAVGPLLLVRVRWADGVAVLLAGAVVVIPLVAGRDDDRRRTAWRGAGPAVFQLLALVCALALSSLLVLGVGDWLNGGNTPASLVRTGVALRPFQPVIRVPPVYGWFALALVVSLLALVLVCVLDALVAVLFREPPPAAPGTPEPPASVALAGRRRSSRKVASFTQRAEPLVGVAGVLSAVCVGLALVWAANLSQSATGGGWYEDGSVALFAMGASTIAIVLVAGGTVGSARPLGLLWDLICVVPRAAHPLGPPCYAERAVPEITRRVDAWLTDQPARRVVISAHSLGCVLAAAVVMGMPQADPRVRLLTYGSQLRAYFGRLFPELLGADPLGVPPCQAPAPLAPDAWSRPAPPLDTPGSGSLSRRVRWLSLWRRTDYIGFPVVGYATNATDRPAQEYDDSNYQLSVVSHSDYPRSTAYADALQELLAD